MEWITGRYLHFELPSWIANVFYTTILLEIRHLLDVNFGLDACAHELELEIFRNESNPSWPLYGVRLYYNNILLREYNEWTDYMICYFEPKYKNYLLGTNKREMYTALDMLWKL